jgi:hypothetical protein
MPAIEAGFTDEILQEWQPLPVWRVVRCAEHQAPTMGFGHSDVSVNRMAYIKNDAADSRSIAEMEALESSMCNQFATSQTGDGNESAINY